MKKKILYTDPHLDNQFLEETYGEDHRKVSEVFRQYLKMLPVHQTELSESLHAHDIYRFRDVINKLIPSLNLVGLTELSNKLQYFLSNCRHAQDLILYKIEIEQALSTIQSTTPVLENIVVEIERG